MSQRLFTSSQEAEQAFYEAFRRADLEAMMAVWSEDDEVYCIHPGGPRLAGIEQIRESWRQIFSGGTGMRIQVRDPQVFRAALLAVHNVYEVITLAGEQRPRSAVVATNVYLNTPNGWRMIAHHGSPLAGPAPARSESTPTVLH